MEEPVQDPVEDLVQNPRQNEGPYDWYTRGLALLEAGSAAAAEQLLARAAAAEPESRSVLEALGRAQFDARQYAKAKATFTRIIEADPTDDYGQFALGLSAPGSANCEPLLSIWRWLPRCDLIWPTTVGNCGWPAPDSKEPRDACRGPQPVGNQHPARHDVRRGPARPRRCGVRRS